MHFLSGNDLGRTSLLVYGVEELLTAAGTLLNGFRERLGYLRATVIAVRENRRRDFLMACPDLVDWIGPRIARVEDFVGPLTAPQIRRAIRNLANKYGISSEAFLRDHGAAGGVSKADAWLWAELLAIASEFAEVK